MVKISDVIDFNELKNKATDKDIDKFEEYIYSMYYTMSQGKLSMAEMSRKIQKYMLDNNISQEKFMNIQKKLMERYGFSMDDIEKEMSNLGIDNNSVLGSIGKDYEGVRKAIGFQEKYNARMSTKTINTYSISNDKNSLEIILQDENVILKSFKKIDLTDNELNEFLCSYKKIVKEKMLNISICENASTYLY